MRFFGTDQILVRQRYGYKIRGGIALKITDIGAAVKKGYIVYLTTYLLPVNNNLPLHLFWSKLQYYYIMIRK